MTLAALKEEAARLPKNEQVELTAVLMEHLFQTPWEHALAAECEAIIDSVDREEMPAADGPAFFAQLRQELAR